VCAGGGTADASIVSAMSASGASGRVVLLGVDDLVDDLLDFIHDEVVWVVGWIY
jgi:hypothetical protein